MTDPFLCICDPDDLFDPPDPRPRAVEGCPAHRGRRAAQHLAEMLDVEERMGPPPADGPAPVPPPVDALEEILNLVEEVALARVKAFNAGNRDDAVKAKEHSARAAGYRLAIAVLIEDVRAAGVAEGRRQATEERTALVLDTTERTLRTAANWLESDKDSSMLVESANAVKSQGADEACCPVCEEVECDGDCPLATLRTAADGG